MSKHRRDVTFRCDNLTLFEGVFLKLIVEAWQKGKEIKIETDEEFETRIQHEQTARPFGLPNSGSV